MSKAGGAIILARHAEPALSRRTRLDAEGYRAWWATYEVGGLKPGQAVPPALAAAAAAAATVLASTRRRSVETAEALTGGRPFACDPQLIEAPLPPPVLPSWLKLSPRQWGVIARAWWWFLDHHGGEESRRQAERRAETVADSLIARAAEGDVLVVAHGFFNAMIGRALKRRGWRCTRDGGYAYWSARRFEAPRRPRIAGTKGGTP